MNSEEKLSLNEMKQLILELHQENIDTNFLPTLHEHLKVIKQYKAKSVEGVTGHEAFSDKKEYQKFCASSLFYLNLRHQLFQKKNAAIEDNDFKDNIPQLEAFNDEKEEHKKQAMESLKQGDVLHLRIIEEMEDEFKLEIINKYGDKRRFSDFSLFAFLLKKNPLVEGIHPPLQISDYLRAAVFGSVQQENGVFKKMMVTLNDNFVKDAKLKSLELGKIYKKDIPFYPEDLSEYKCLGEYLMDNNKFETEKQTLGDPVKTCPFYDGEYKKQLVEPVNSSLSEEIKKLTIFGDKLKAATDSLYNGDLENALLDVEEVLQAFPYDDRALTLRGKIYLAMAGGKPSRKVNKAIKDFIIAMGINPLNKEAEAFYDLTVMEHIESRFPQSKTEIQARLKCPKHVDETAKAFLDSFKVGIANKAVLPASTDTITNTGAASIGTSAVRIKEEPMDLCLEEPDGLN